ncbi:unnamed protein product [Boreogadus saida]
MRDMNMDWVAPGRDRDEREDAYSLGTAPPVAWEGNCPLGWSWKGVGSIPGQHVIKPFSCSRATILADLRFNSQEP